MIDLNALAEQTAQNSICRGFRKAGPPTPTEAMARVALIMTELAEVVEELRLEKPILGYALSCYERGLPDGKPIGVENELVDIILRTLDLGEAYGFDMEKSLQAKADYNDERPMGYGGRVR